VEEKRRIVEETLIEGASVARVARAHGVNANQVFGWRRLYLAGQLGGSGAIKLLPVQVKGSPALATLPRVEDSSSTSLSGTIWRELSNLLMNPERIELGLRTGARLARC
jgi:transposase